MSLHSAPLEGGVLEAWEDLEDKTDNKEEAENGLPKMLCFELRYIALKCQTEPKYHVSIEIM